MTTAQKIIWGSAAVLVVAAALAVKWLFFPSIKDAYFTMNDRSFRQVPSGLVAVRPTHFTKSVRKGILSDNIRVAGKPIWRMMGRNITLEQLIGVAYGRSQARVVLPASAPKTNFDFIVTARGDLQKELQKAFAKNSA